MATLAQSSIAFHYLLSSTCDPWIIDTSANEHMIGLSTSLSNYHPVDMNHSVTLEGTNRCFEGLSRTREELLHFFLVTLFSWTTGWLAPRVISFVDFISFFSLST
jgi:hypothetical protein